MIVVSTNSSVGLSSKLSASMGSTVAPCITRRFPDGELYVRIDADLKEQDVVVVGSTRTDSDVLETLFLLTAARENGARTVRAVIPYYGYARQHMIYKPGESISSKAILKTMENWCDEIISVELHDLETAGYSSKTFVNLSVIGSIADHFSNKKVDYVISPDDGGFERAGKVGEILDCSALYIDKKRIDSTTVEMILPEVDYKGRNVLLIDDIISTGGTIMKAIALLRSRGVSKIFVTAVHGVFASGSQSRISAICDGLAVTDTIESNFSTISVASDIARFLKEEKK
jgi:ribose-phosphate pyrophosphokinase